MLSGSAPPNAATSNATVTSVSPETDVVENDFAPLALFLFVTTY
jgi:hypothetical protein